MLPAQSDSYLFTLYAALIIGSVVNRISCIMLHLEMCWYILFIVPSFCLYNLDVSNLIHNKFIF